MGQFIPAYVEKQYFALLSTVAWRLANKLKLLTQVKYRLNATKALSLTSLGHSKEFFIVLYKVYLRYIFSYVSNAQAHIQILERTQNSALRCTRSTPSPSLHVDKKVLSL